MLFTNNTVSSKTMDVMIALIKTKDYINNTPSFLYNWTIGLFKDYDQRKKYKWTQTPLNGPRLCKLLFDVHAHQIFHNGLFNSDPHCGNLFLSDDGTLSLIDYGAACRLTVDQRIKFARLIKAICSDDDDDIVKAAIDFGFVTKRSNKTFILTYTLMCFHRGFHPDDFERCGIPPEVGVMEIENYLMKFDKWESCPGYVAMLQRCSQVLLGVAAETGSGSISVAHMWEEEATKYLESIGEV